MNNTWKMQRKNNKDEKQINLAYKKDYTNLIIYLRGFDISLYHQEYIRQDIINMILDGQERDASLKEIFGDDLKAFMDDVLEAAPKMSKGQKFLENISNIFLIILPALYLGWILVYMIFEGIGQGFLTQEFHLGLSRMITISFSLFYIYIAMNNMFKNSFDPVKEGTIQYIMLFALLTVNGVASFYLDKYDDQIFVKVKNISIILGLLVGMLFGFAIKVHIARTYHKDIIKL